MKLLLTICFLFLVNVSKAQVPYGDTILVPMFVTLFDSTSYYRVYYANGTVKQNQVLWKDVRVPKGGTWEELDYKGGQEFVSKGWAVNVTRDSTGTQETIEYLGLNMKPFPPPYQRKGVYYEREGVPLIFKPKQ